MFNVTFIFILQVIVAVKKPLAGEDLGVYVVLLSREFPEKVHLSDLGTSTSARDDAGNQTLTTLMRGQNV